MINERLSASSLGSRPDAAQRKLLQFQETFAPDFIDIQCGCLGQESRCPTRRRWALKDLKLFETIVRATVSGTRPR